MNVTIERLISGNPFGGQPGPYVAARASGLRGRLVREWGQLLFAEKFSLPEDYVAEGPVAVRTVDIPWAVFHLRLRRMHASMDEAMRDAFGPVLAFHELGVVFSALRFKARDGSTEPVERLLGPSAINSRLKRKLILASTQAEAAGHILTAAGGLAPSLRPDEGPRRIEAAITAAFISRACGSAGLHHDVRPYFMYLASMRNIITMHKHIRWAELLRASSSEDFSAGLIRCGTIDHMRIARASTADDVMALVGTLTRGTRPGSAVNVEAALLSGMVRMARIRAHSSATPEAVVMDAIVRAHAEARNLAVIAATRDLDRSAVREELVQ